MLGENYSGVGLELRLELLLGKLRLGLEFGLASGRVGGWGLRLGLGRNWVGIGC